MQQDDFRAKITRRYALHLLAAAAGLLLWPGLGAAAPVPARKPSAPRLLVLDAGHGGRDPGAIGRRGTREKDVVLDLARRLARELADHPTLRIRLTRDTDRFLPLAERVQMARAWQADLLISLHADSAPNPAARGFSAYTLAATASDDFARQLAKTENAADLAGGIVPEDTDAEVAAILLDLAARHTRSASQQAKEAIIRGVGRDLRLLDNPMRSANFAVLRAPDVPSLLLETGFLSNSRDEERLRDPAARAVVARILARELAAVLAAPPFAG